MRALLLVAASLVGLVSPAFAEGLTVTGDVTYRERIALPPQAELTVSLVEIETGAIIVGATAAIPERGQVPLAYSLNLRHQPHADKTYGLNAEIRSNGQLWFKNDFPVEIDLAAAVPTSIVVHRVPDPDQATLNPPLNVPPTPSLKATNWSVSRVNGRPFEGHRKPTISFDETTQVYGTGGCNRYVTSASIADDRLSFGIAGTTNLACDVRSMQREREFFFALSSVSNYTLTADTLQLFDPKGHIVLDLARD